MDEEELNKIIRKLEGMMKSTNDSSRHIASSIKALPDTLSLVVDDVIYDRARSLGEDIGKAISKELDVRADILESTIASIHACFAESKKFIRALYVLAGVLLLILLASVALNVMALRIYFSMDLTNSALIKVPLLHADSPSPPVPPKHGK